MTSQCGWGKFYKAVLLHDELQGVKGCGEWKTRLPYREELLYRLLDLKWSDCTSLRSVQYFKRQIHSMWTAKSVSFQLSTFTMACVSVVSQYLHTDSSWLCSFIPNQRQEHMYLTCTRVMRLTENEGDTGRRTGGRSDANGSSPHI